MWNYLCFLWKSTNQHGVHSPFVFQYITKGVYFYKKKYAQQPKSLQWLLSTLDYFQPKSIYCATLYGRSSLISWQVVMQNNCKDAQFIICHLHKSADFSIIEECIDQLRTDQLLGICVENYSTCFVEKIKNNPKITVVVDFFYGILISKRTEQHKQNFYIRL